MKLIRPTSRQCERLLHLSRQRIHRKPKRLVSRSRRQQLHQDKLAAEKCAQESDAKAKQAEQQASAKVATAEC